MTWQPIETAPKSPDSPRYEDRIYVDLWVKDCFGDSFRVTNAYWDVTTEGSGFWERMPMHCTPTHWMPVPEAPKTEEGQ